MTVDIDPTGIVEDPDPPRFNTQAEDDAYAQGYEQGYIDGHDRAYTIGCSHGYAKALDSLRKLAGEQ